MKRIIGTFFMVLGVLLLVGAAALYGYNRHEQTQAAESAEALMPQVVDAILKNQEAAATEPEETTPLETYDPDSDVVILPTEPEIPEMTVTEIDGYGYIGFVSFPTLGSELPVMADWSYDQLKIAPCRYTGSVFTDDLVLMAHNYWRHFGQINDLRVGDTVTFTDMDGITTYYEVVAVDVLNPTAIEEMTAGEFDLTLFTCTYGGRSRVTVRCDRIDE